MRMRKKRRTAERLFALSSLICDNLTSFSNFSNLSDLPKNGVEADTVFERALPLRLEIGCGKGDFICEISKAEPKYNYFAMERVSDVIVTAAEKYAASRGLGGLSPRGLWTAPDGRVFENGERWDIPLSLRGNVRFIPGAAEQLEEMFLPDTFETIYANFSDPWPKKGQEGRRLTSPAFLETYLRLLIPGGFFKFKTDNIGLFEYSLEAVGKSGLELVYYTNDLHNSERSETNIQTEYEKSFSAKGFCINYLEAKKK